MALDPKGARSRSDNTSESPTRRKLTRAEMADKLYGGTTPAPGRPSNATPTQKVGVEGLIARAGRDSGVRLAPDCSVQPDGTIRLRVTIPGVSLDGLTRIKLNRDRNRPLEFDGRLLAEVNEPAHGGAVMLRAAIYETRGGKFVNELTRFEVEPGVDYGDAKPPYLFAKAEVFDSRDIAAMWFRTKGGRLTERLMQQLGDVESEFID
jgi:hypothetical protein